MIYYEKVAHVWAVVGGLKQHKSGGRQNLSAPRKPRDDRVPTAAARYKPTCNYRICF